MNILKEFGLKKKQNCLVLNINNEMTTNFSEEKMEALRWWDGI